MGVPWTGGDRHGEPRGDTLERGKPERKKRLFPRSNGIIEKKSSKDQNCPHTWSSQWFAVEVVGSARGSVGG